MKLANGTRVSYHYSAPEWKLGQGTVIYHTTDGFYRVKWDEPNTDPDFFNTERVFKPEELQEIPKQWGYLIRNFAQWYACGVFRDPKGDLYFCWGVDSGESPREQQNIEHVCQVASVVETISQRYNKDHDLIDRQKHAEFLREWAPKVKNPEIADIFRSNQIFDKRKKAETL